MGPSLRGYKKQSISLGKTTTTIITFGKNNKNNKITKSHESSGRDEPGTAGL